MFKTRKNYGKHRTRLQQLPAQTDVLIAVLEKLHVPELTLNAQKYGATTLRNILKRFYDVGTLDWLFFSLWASSTTRQAQSMEPRIAMSMVISS